MDPWNVRPDGLVKIGELKCASLLLYAAHFDQNDVRKKILRRKVEMLFFPRRSISKELIDTAMATRSRKGGRRAIRKGARCGARLTLLAMPTDSTLNKVVGAH
jgi:hypothetical protein